MISNQLYIYCGFTRFKSFHFFGTIGFLLGTALGIIIAYQLHLDIIIILLMALIGAVTLFGLTYLSKIITGNENIVYYHHEIAIMIFCTIALYFLKMPVLQYLDITLLGIATFLAFGRIGCYSVGCCHGRPHKHGVKYEQDHVDAGFTWYYKDVPLLPVQLIESAYVFLMVIVGVALLFNNVLPGTFLVLYTVVYGLMRYILEFFRGDPDRPYWHGLSEAQWTTIILIAFTYILSKVDWVPQYTWHLVILVVLQIISVIIIFHYRKKQNYFIFTPRHVRQIAEGLNILENKNTESFDSNGKTINLISTDTGLCMSCGDLHNESESISHYTISLNATNTIGIKSVKEIGRLIGLIKKHPEQQTIFQNQEGIYHIVFTKLSLREEVNNEKIIL